LGLNYSQLTSHPLTNEIEVTLIGTGGGYGESVLIHLGNNNWIVIDSCIDPITKTCLPLDYLKNIGVDLKENVKSIICTHWHDDHIKGISELLNACESSEFCFGKASDLDKFLLLVGIDSHKGDFASSTKELAKCLNILNNRSLKNFATIKTAIQDRVLFRFEEQNIESSIISLSPSDHVVSEFDKELSSLMSEHHHTNMKIISRSPNEKSVVLLVKINDINILLGSDLELSSDKRKGWECILNHSQFRNSKSVLFKIPHHGSKNGFYQRIWDELLTDNPISKLTPWSLGGNSLPTNDMLKTYSDLTSELYITLQNKSFTPKKREKRISKTIYKFNNTLREIKYSLGIVRSRLKIGNHSNQWKIECIDKATKVSSTMF